MEAPPKEPLIITDKTQMRNWSRKMRGNGKTIGLVPTMGFLHKGHISLIQESLSKTHLTVVSIYINPKQFGPSEDLSTYPSDFTGDLEKIKGVVFNSNSNSGSGVDVVFRPYDLYEYGDGDKDNSNNKHESWVRVEDLEKGLCGKSRPVFFRGVATVVAKLFNIVEPDFVVLGKKDYQQWRVLRRMVRDLDYAIEVVGSEIVREDDGLAMSSRNVHLSPEDRKKALSINQSLFKAKYAAQKGQICSNDLKNLVIQAVQEAGGKIDYAEIVDQESLEAMEEIKGGVVFCVAAWFGKVRLIDNVEINI